MQEHSPESKSDWEQLVTQAHVKNTMIQNHGFTPFQFVFGRNPDVPTELLDEPLHVVPATLGLTDEAIRKAQEIRTTACKAVIDLQSDQSSSSSKTSRDLVFPSWSLWPTGESKNTKGVPSLKRVMYFWEDTGLVQLWLWEG